MLERFCHNLVKATTARVHASKPAPDRMPQPTFGLTLIDILHVSALCCAMGNRAASTNLEERAMCTCAVPVAVAVMHVACTQGLQVLTHSHGHLCLLAWGLLAGPAHHTLAVL